MTGGASLRDRLQTRSDEDLIDIIRLHDADEWQPEVFAVAEAILMARGVDLRRELARTSEPATDPPGDPPVVIATFATVVESEACRSALTAAGFTVVGGDEFVLRVDPALGPALGGFQLGVPTSEAEEARQFLAAAETGELADGTLECSQCGSTDVAAHRNVSRSGTLANAFLVGPAIQDVEITYKCRACGSDWQ